MTTPIRSATLWLLLGATAPGTPLAAQSRPAPWPATVFTLTITRVIQNGPPVTLDLHGISARGVARLDITGGTDASSFPAGSYMLVSDSSGAARLIDTVRKTVHIVGAGARLGGLVELYTPPGTISDVTVTLDTLGAGEVIEGRATRHYRITTRFSLTLSSETGQVGAAHSSSVTDLWQADGRERIPNPFLGLGGDGSPDDSLALLNRVLAEMGRRLPGFTILSKTQASLSARGITFTHQQVTTQLSGLRPAEVDPSRLQMPSNVASPRD